MCALCAHFCCGTRYKRIVCTLCAHLVAALVLDVHTSITHRLMLLTLLEVCTSRTSITSATMKCTHNVHRTSLLDGVARHFLMYASFTYASLLLFYASV